MALDANDNIPLKTPVNTKRRITSIGKGKVSWISWKNLTFGLIWLVISALIGFLTVNGKLWVQGVVFGCIAAPGLALFLIPIPHKEYYWLYNYIIDGIKFWFDRNSNRFPNLGATSEFIPYDKIIDNKLFLKGTEAVHAFYRINGRNIYACAAEVQNSLLSDYHSLIKNLHGATVKIVGFQTNFKLENQYNYFKGILNSNSKIITSFLIVASLVWQNWQFMRNFPFYKDRKENLNFTPTPRDMAYFLVVAGDSELLVDELAKLIVPNLMATDSAMIEEASVNDIKTYIAKQFGVTSIDEKNGYTIIEKDGRKIYKINEQFTNMQSLTFKVKHYETLDFKPTKNVSARHCHKMITITDFRTEAMLGWMDTLFQDPGVDLIQVKYNELPLEKQTKLIGKAINQYTKVEKKSDTQSSFGAIKMSDTFEFLRDLEQKTGRAEVSLVKTTIYIKIRATSVEELNRKEIEIKYRFKKDLGIGEKNYDTFWFNQRNALLSAMGSKLTKLDQKIGIFLISSAIAIGWPFNNPRIIQPQGFHIGFTANGLCPVCLNFAQQRSFSGMIVGKTGSGKSLLAKLITLQLLLNPSNKIFWFDPENEMSSFAANTDAIQIDLTSQVPVVEKISFEELMNEFLYNNLKWTSDRFYNTYYTLLNVTDGYKFLFGAKNSVINKMSIKEMNSSLTRTPLIQEDIDFFGKGSLKNHSRQVYVTNWQITPTDVLNQVVELENKVKGLTNITEVKDLYVLYNFLFKKTVRKSNINPYRIVLTTDNDAKSFNAFNLYNNHRQLLLTWFKQLMPKADVVHTTWFNFTVNRLYKMHCNVEETIQDNQMVINQTVTELISKETFPTIEDHYKILLDDYNKLLKKCANNPTIADNEQIKKYNEVITVFDNLVEKNRFGERGLFYYLWTTDNKFEFNHHKQMLVYNIQSLLTHVKNIIENNYTDAIRFDFQNIFNAQYFLSQQIIWSHVVTNRNNNATKLGARESDKDHVYIFMDEAHASLKQPQFVDWSVNMIKRARKYSSGIWLITQSIGDYTKLADAQELFNNFMFKFYFQSEAIAFDDIIKKFKVSKVPLTNTEEKWLNPILGDTTQGRCILTFEDGKRYMINIVTSTAFIIKILEQNLIDNKEFRYTNDYGVNESFGSGVNGWLNWLKSNQLDLEKSENDKIITTMYKTWKSNNLKKYDYNEWVKSQIKTKTAEEDNKLAKAAKAKADYKLSLETSKQKGGK